MRWLQICPTVVLMILLVASCATAPPSPPTVDVTGAWAGTFEGKALGVTRSGAAEAQFTQSGSSGTGRMRFAYAAGDAFQPVNIVVEGHRVTATHEAGAQYLTVVLSVDGDTMSGQITSSGVPVAVTLKRQR
jgi:hypothetical protein